MLPVSIFYCNLVIRDFIFRLILLCHYILIDLYSDNDAKILGNQFYTALTRAKVQGAIIKHENLNLDFNV